ncbi:hypothetical protein TrLO_g6527 [Triparma laevis f. longispina]|uniref:Uncharacterized protein n=1 Tax=Triparma laevis f. longispina TaxID=1714387 RepID=A0A9W6ZSM4_9STRA|nr:hypothetical protein TrLO_g6527 [Triparma laevis f. longispina]
MDLITQALVDPTKLDALLLYLSAPALPNPPQSPSHPRPSQAQTITFLLNAIRVSRTQFGEASLRRRASSSFSAPSLSPRSTSVPEARSTEDWPPLSTAAPPPATELATSMIKKKKKKEKRRIRPQLNSVSFMSISSHQAHQAFAAPTSTLTDMVKDVKIVEEELKEELSSLLDAADLTTPNVDDVAQAPLPVQFDKDRDSRHNYKSRELAAVYKNRETTRDAFLLMLRDFKTSGFTKHAVTVDSSHLITQLTEFGNLDWFSDFFVLTVTHMGEGEVDEEVKRLGAEKVGKLARRFNAPPTAATSPALPSEVSQFFLGNLEFFYLFLSCPFSALLTPFLLPRFLFELHSILKDSATSLVSRIRRATVCARFIGLLIKGKGGKGEGVNVKEWAESSKPPIDLRAHIVSAHVNNSLTITLPYTTTILKLLHHSPLYSTSKDVTDCLKLLSEIGRDQAQIVQSSSTSCNSNSMFIICEIEGVLTSYGRSLLYSSNSPPLLPQLKSDPMFSSSLKLYPNNQNLDKQPQHFPLRFLTSSFPPLQTLHTCIDDLIRNSERITGGRRMSKKMRPHMVGLNQSQIANNLHYNSTPTSTTPNPIALTRNPSTDSLSGLGTPHFNLSEQLGLIAAQSPIGASPSESTPNKQGISPTKFASHANLVSHFFHLHPALLPVCSFITSSVIKKVCADVVDQIIVPIVTECLSPTPPNQRDLLNPAHQHFDLRSHQKALENITTKANHQITTILASTPPLIKHLLDLLSPPSPAGVLTECIAICTDFVQREGEGVLKNIIRKEGRAKMESFQWPTPTHPNRFDGVQPPTFHPPAHIPSTHPPTPLEIYLTKLVNNEENITIPALPPPSLPPSSTSIHHLNHLFKRFFVSVERQNAKIESPPPPHFFFVMTIALNLSLTDPNVWEKSLTQPYVFATLNMLSDSPSHSDDTNTLIAIYSNTITQRGEKLRGAK